MTPWQENVIRMLERSQAKNKTLKFFYHRAVLVIMFSIFAETSVAMDIFKEDMSPWYVYTSSMEKPTQCSSLSWCAELQIWKEWYLSSGNNWNSWYSASALLPVCVRFIKSLTILACALGWNNTELKHNGNNNSFHLWTFFIKNSHHLFIFWLNDYFNELYMF